MMLSSSPINGFVRVTDPKRTREFYEGVLGLKFVSENPFVVVFSGQNAIIIAQRVDKFPPLQSTVLGWEVKDIWETVSSLSQRGVVFHRYDGMDQDELGIWKSPDGKVAWFKDPDGNVLSVSEHPNY
ncbi:MAG TPA: VOC family protein [Terriglobia bacterium]|nr:VOC family protein [Terriglobia bacterium]